MRGRMAHGRDGLLVVPLYVLSELPVLALQRLDGTLQDIEARGHVQGHSKLLQLPINLEKATLIIVSKTPDENTHTPMNREKCLWAPSNV